ncbi:ABC-2 transporter permease [Paenibacillus woosongensis]|nr:ABC-2 transporter permease [Paenibacillus woosongensis]
MLKLLFMELYTQKKIAFLIPIIMFPLFLTLGDRISGSGLFPTIIFSLAVGFISYFLTSYSNSNTGETEKLQYKLLLSLPLSRKMIIAAKYATIFLWWLISYIWLILVLLLLKYAAGIHMEQPILNWEVAFLSLCCSYFMNAIFYPLYFRYGYRTANIIGIMVFFTLSNFAGKLGSLDPSSQAFASLLAYPLTTFASLTAVLVLFTYLISLLIFIKTDY